MGSQKASRQERAHAKLILFEAHANVTHRTTTPAETGLERDDEEVAGRLFAESLERFRRDVGQSTVFGPEFPLHPVTKVLPHLLEEIKDLSSCRTPVVVKGRRLFAGDFLKITDRSRLGAHEPAIGPNGKDTAREPFDMRVVQLLVVLLPEFYLLLGWTRLVARGVVAIRVGLLVGV